LPDRPAGGELLDRGLRRGGQLVERDARRVVLAARRGARGAGQHAGGGEQRQASRGPDHRRSPSSVAVRGGAAGVIATASTSRLDRRAILQTSPDDRVTAALLAARTAQPSRGTGGRRAGSATSRPSFCSCVAISPRWAFRKSTTVDEGWWPLLQRP